MRGGTVLTVLGGALRLGLSPLARGNLVYALERSGRLRSIPACAGEPVGGQRGAPIARVYPRLRGGTALLQHALSLG